MRDFHLAADGFVLSTILMVFAKTLAGQTICPRGRVQPKIIALAIAAILLFTTLFGKLSGHWQSSVIPEQMSRQIQYL